MKKLSYQKQDRTHVAEYYASRKPGGNEEANNGTDHSNRYFIALRNDDHPTGKLDSEFSGVSRKKALGKGLAYFSRWSLSTSVAEGANQSHRRLPLEELHTDDILWMISIRKDRVLLIGRARLLPDLERVRQDAREGELPSYSLRRFAWREAKTIPNKKELDITTIIGSIVTTMKTRSSIRPSAENFDVPNGVKRLKKYLKNKPPQEITRESSLFLDKLMREASPNWAANDSIRESSSDDPIPTLEVEWAILPPGLLPDDALTISQGYGVHAKEAHPIILARMNLLATLKPQAWIAGQDGFNRYFGAKFSDKLVVFENVLSGNAIYVMYEDWEKTCRHSRIELLKTEEFHFDRVVHRGDWQERLMKILRKAIAEAK